MKKRILSQLRTPKFLILATILLAFLLTNATEDLVFAQQTVFFQDAFDETVLDPNKWVAFQNAGTITVSGGMASLSSPGPSFPFVITRTNPFPPGGDFILKVGMQYTSVGPLGPGLVADVGAPINGQASSSDPGSLEVAGIWQDNSSNFNLFTFFSTLPTFLGAAFNSSTSAIVGAAPELNFHIYEFNYNAATQTFSVFVDGSLIAASQTRALRPTAIWFGNPAVVGAGWSSFKIDFIEVVSLTGLTPLGAPVAIAGTSLDGNNMLQLDGSLSSDPNNDPLTFSWQIEGELTPRLGRIVSIADLAVGNYKVALTVSDGVNSSTDTMLFGVPARAGVVVPTTNSLQQATLWVKDLITGFPNSSFDAPTPQARENRRKALLNMLDRVFTSIGIGDYQAAIIQLRDILDKTDELGPPNSAPDWIIGTDAKVTANAVSHLIADLLWICPECR